MVLLPDRQPPIAARNIVEALVGGSVLLQPGACGALNVEMQGGSLGRLAKDGLAGGTRMPTELLGPGNTYRINALTWGLCHRLVGQATASPHGQITECVLAAVEARHAVGAAILLG